MVGSSRRKSSWASLGSAGAEEVGEEAVGAGDEFRELAIEGVGDVDVGAFAGVGDEEAAALRVLAGVGGLGQRRIGCVPRIEKGVAAFFCPAVKVSGCDLVRPDE